MLTACYNLVAAVVGNGTSINHDHLRSGDVKEAYGIDASSCSTADGYFATGILRWPTMN